MTPRKILLLVLALLIAGGTVYLVRGTNRAEPQAEARLRVLVAAKELPIGHILGENDVRWQDWPDDSPTAGYVVQQADTPADVTGSVLRERLRAGQPLVVGQFVKPNESGFLAAVLQPGMRAVTVPVTNITGVGGFIFPGDRVDVILTHEVRINADPDRPERQASETVLRDARVLAIDQKTNDTDNTPRLATTATLEVTPKQAETVTLVQKLGTLSLVLRSLGKDDSPTAPSVTWDSDVSQILPKPAARATEMQRVQILRGSAAEEKTMDGGR